MTKKEILRVKELSLAFLTPKGTMAPVRDLNLKLYSGEILVILGESGAGKSLLAKAIMGILPKDAKITSGEILSLYGPRDMAMVLQDPKKLLDPSMTIGSQIMEGLKYAGVRREGRKKRALELLEEVAMDNPEGRFKEYPYELSGGLAQRAVMAVALAKSPKLLLADEPTTALDEVNEEKIVNLFIELTKKKAMSTLLITHSLKVAEMAADRIAVMYAGRIIEMGLRDEVLNHAVHPYTQALILAASLKPDEKGNLSSIRGMAPCPMNPPSGDAFSHRNPDALGMDFLEEPPMMRITNTHYAATWLLDERYLKARDFVVEQVMI